MAENPAHLVDQRLQRVGKTAILTVEAAWIFEQIASAGMTRQDFLAREVEQPVAHGTHVFGQFPGNGGHRNTSVTIVRALLARSLRGASADRPGKPRYETCIAHWRRGPADTI